MKEKIKNKVMLSVLKLRNVVSDIRAEGYVDSGVKILIAIVIGSLLLTLLYALFSDTIMPTVTSKVTEMFSYSSK